ncbi:efflux transporter outer membrane subunit [Extensimonas vulgaris]|nr:efflux transporter outer membrane subunit [Extensimonas vulgaris]TXD16852.1 efflux transporter outer membrane subunit [Extensimonas vulgaris]
MGQEDGKKWAAAAHSQPTIPKSDRLLAATATSASAGFAVRVRGFPAAARALACAGFTGLAALTGCADHAGIAPQVQMRDAASLGLTPASAPAADAAGAAAGHANAPGVALQTDWWRMWGDAQLDALVAKALAGNPSLQQAQARLASAWAFSEAVRASDGPRLDGSLQVDRQHFSAHSLYPPPYGGGSFNLAEGTLTGSWELDFFGKHRAALAAAIGAARAAEADAQAARLLLASSVVRSYFQLARLQAQLAVAERTLAQREETLQLVRERFAAGLDTRVELRQSEGGVPDARQQVEALREQIALMRNAIGALVSEPKAALALDTPSLTAIKAVEIPAQLPAELLGHRPDIAAARWRVEAATRSVDEARSLFYPNVNLAAFVGLSSIGLDNFARASSKEWGFGPAISLPIFDSGRLRANLRGKSADLDAAVASYNASLLDAVHDVADQLDSARSIVRQQTEQRQAQAAAEAAYALALERYRQGLTNYLTVLAAETNVLAQRRLGVDLAARRLDTQVNLIRALGGGYQATLPETLASSAR